LPEGDTIFVAAQRLGEALTGKVVAQASPAPLRRYEGQKIESVEARGKHLFILFEKGLRLHSHMGMTGKWRVLHPPVRLPARGVRAVIDCGDAVAVCLDAPTVEVVRSEEVRTAHLGPDLLGSEFDVAAVVVRARRSGASTAGELLRDQTVAAGIGNIHACDSMWVTRVHPWTPPSALDDETVIALYTAARRRLRESAILGRRPRAEVYGRAGRNCRRCGTVISVRSQGKQARPTYWCPVCQPERV
jgi:endonuclease-8